MRVLGAVALTMAIAACGAEEGSVSDEPAGGLMREVPMLSDPEAPREVEARRFVIRETPGVGIGGEATVDGDTLRTGIRFMLRGAAPNVPLRVAIHGGSCEAVGLLVEDVARVVADAGGSASGSASLPLPASVVLDGRHALVVQSAPLPAEVIAACGEIPAGALPP